MDEADFLCDRIGIINHGKILVIDTVANLKKSVGNDIVTLSCSDITALQKRLQEESWIKNAKLYTSLLSLGVERGEEKIPVIFEIARSLGITITSIDVRRPTLDDVFLYYTGQSIREKDLEAAVKKPKSKSMLSRWQKK